MKITVKKGTPRTMDATDHRTYEEWEHAVDRLLLHCTGLSFHDLPDCDTHRWYANRLRPIHAANKLLKNAGADGF